MKNTRTETERMKMGLFANVRRGPGLREYVAMAFLAAATALPVVAMAVHFAPVSDAWVAAAPSIYAQR